MDILCSPFGEFRTQFPCLENRFLEVFLDFFNLGLLFGDYVIAALKADGRLLEFFLHTLEFGLRLPGITLCDAQLSFQRPNPVVPRVALCRTTPSTNPGEY